MRIGKKAVTERFADRSGWGIAPTLSSQAKPRNKSGTFDEFAPNSRLLRLVGKLLHYCHEVLKNSGLCSDQLIRTWKFAP
jgi:hypothetical protein